MPDPQTPDAKSDPKKPAESGYWRNVSPVNQVIFSPDESQKTIPPGVLVHEDQFTDPKVLPRMKGIFIKTPSVDTAKQEKKNGRLVVGGKYNTANGHYVPATPEKAASAARPVR